MAQSDELATGTMVGSYRIAGKLGEGGMGVIYLAEHPLIGRKAAVKVLHSDISTESPDVVTRFFNEARSTNFINHPAMVNIFDSGYLENGCAYLVMELLAGESLGARLKRLGQLPVGEVVEIAGLIADALAAAHEKMIVHRDLKPDNVFVGPSKVPGKEGALAIRILDFGVAKLAGAVGAMGLKTQTGTLLGTPLYMSPEQCRGAASVDHRTDIYALGCMMFEMAAGKPPFAFPSMIAVIDAHMNEPPPSLIALVPSLPTELDAIVARALAKQAEDRFPSMTALGESLAAVLPKVRSSTAAPPIVDSHDAVTLRPGSRRPVVGPPPPATDEGAAATGGRVRLALKVVLAIAVTLAVAALVAVGYALSSR